MFISTIIKNIRNLFPYFLLIAVYFFFVNIEARKTQVRDQKLNKMIDKDKTFTNTKNDKNNSSISDYIKVR